MIKKIVPLLMCFGISNVLIAQDTTTTLAGKKLVITQSSTDTTLVSAKQGAYSIFNVTSPATVSGRNPYFSLGVTNSSGSATSPYLSIGGNWLYYGDMDASKAKLLLYGNTGAPADVIGMGVSGTRGLEFYKGTSPGYYFSGKVAVGNGGNATTLLYDSALFIGRNWSSSYGSLPYLYLEGGVYSGNGDATKAKLRMYGTTATSIIGIGVSSNSNYGVEYFSGQTGTHTFYGNIKTPNNITTEGTLNVTGRMFEKDTIYFGSGTNGDKIGPNYLSIGRGLSGAMSAPAKIELNSSYADTAERPLKAKLILFGSNETNIIGYGVTGLAGLEVFTGIPNKTTIHGLAKYDYNRGSSFDARTLVDKGYVDSLNKRDTIYFGTTSNADRIGTNYLSIGRGLNGGMSAPAKIDLNNSYADTVNKPMKAKLVLYGSSEQTVIGYGITASAGLEVFTGSPGRTTIHGVAKYDYNRASTFDARTLVDKGYVDSVKSATNLQWNGTNTVTAAITHTGNVGIGGAASTDTTIKLAVNGAIKSKRIVVSIKDWGDYVFDSSYQLTPVEEVAAYVKQYKHLSGMPAAKAIEKEGVDAGEIIKQQQVKIEELTLYIIEQDKKQRALQEQLDMQLKMLKALAEKVK